MRILWTVNTIMPEVAVELGLVSGHAISWVDAMSKRLCLNPYIELAIACPGSVKEIKKSFINNIVYYVFPSDGNDYWGKIIADFTPDLIHAYGTEQCHNLLLVKNHKEVPVLISLQGLLSEYYRHYYAGIPFSEMIKHISIRSILLKNGFFSGCRDFKKRSEVEKEIINQVQYVEGRSTWDKVASLRINPNLKYFYCPRMIRAPFYEANWDVTKIIRHSVFVHQGTYPIKGLHFVFEAIALLKKKYPDVKLYIAGRSLFSPKTLKEKLAQPPYARYLKELVIKFNIGDNIEFVGYLPAKELAARLESMNATVVSSSIENAPNSLAEAELVGTPCIASFVGGNMDMLRHNVDGFLYCYNEPNMLAEYLSRIFESDELANRLSSSAKAFANERHNPEYLESTLLNIYSSIINKE